MMKFNFLAPPTKIVMAAFAIFSSVVATPSYADGGHVKNNGKAPMKLTDLILYGAVKSDGTQLSKVVLKPGDASDDEDLDKGEQRLYTADFVVMSRMVSMLDIHGREVEILALRNVNILPFVFDPQDNFTLAMTSSKAFSATEGSTFNVVNGISDLYPWIFIGTQVDFSSGIISNPYTGRAEISNLISTSVPVPEPGTWAMMLLGFGFIGGAMRSAKRRQKVTVSYA